MLKEMMLIKICIGLPGGKYVFPKRKGGMGFRGLRVST
jgi:hypothetical protein